MPFRSEAQRRYMFSQHPEIAKEFEAATPKGKKLPEHLADGGEVNNAEQIEPGIYGQTDPGNLKAIVDALGSGYATGALGAGLGMKGLEAAKGLGEAGELSIGGSSAPKVEAFVKGVQKNPNGADIKIWGVKGDPKEIAKLGFGEDPASIPEHILQKHDLLPKELPESQQPTWGADKLRNLWSDMAGEQSGTRAGIRAHYEMPDMFQKPKNYCEGGKVMKGYAEGDMVQPEEGDWKDKLGAVLSAMGMGAKSAVAPLMPSPMAPTTPVPAAVNPTGSIQAPIGAVAPPPQPQQQMPVAPPPPPMMPAPTSQAAPAPERPAANDILAKLTDGDGAKMQALLAQLKDQDKRSQFAQALGVIGDTLGNMGMAKAGMRPGGFETPQMLAGMNEARKKSQIENLTQTLAADPNSQTSRMAQQTLMQAMGIKPGDPREASIRRLPAQAITGMMPQMNEAVKANVEREKNLIESRKADVTTNLEKEKIAVEQANSQRAAQAAKTTAAADVLKNIGPVSNALGGPDVRGAAKQTLLESMGGNNATKPLTATNAMGHKIVSHDGGRSWQPIQ